MIDKIAGNGIVQMSPANTSPKLTDYADKGPLLPHGPVRRSPGPCLGDLVVSDGNATTGILALQDAYGVGLADNMEKAITDGGGDVVEKIIYDPKAADFSAEVSKIKAADPDAIVLIGFEETKKIIPELVKQGLGVSEKKWNLVDGNLSNYGMEFPPNTPVGAKGTLPGAETKSDFQTRLRAVDPKPRDFSYAPESYDAAVTISLAAIAAKSDAGNAIATKLVEVARAARSARRLPDCQKLLEQGQDIDYDGVSGPSSSATRVTRPRRRSASTSTVQTTSTRTSSSGPARSDRSRRGQPREGPGSKPGPCGVPGGARRGLLGWLPDIDSPLWSRDKRRSMALERSSTGLAQRCWLSRASSRSSASAPLCC